MRILRAAADGLGCTNFSETQASIRARVFGIVQPAAV